MKIHWNQQIIYNAISSPDIEFNTPKSTGPVDVQFIQVKNTIKVSEKTSSLIGTTSSGYIWRRLSRSVSKAAGISRIGSIDSFIAGPIPHLRSAVRSDDEAANLSKNAENLSSTFLDTSAWKPGIFNRKVQRCPKNYVPVRAASLSLPRPSILLNEIYKATLRLSSPDT